MSRTIIIPVQPLLGIKFLTVILVRLHACTCEQTAKRIVMVHFRYSPAGTYYHSIVSLMVFTLSSQKMFVFGKCSELYVILVIPLPLSFVKFPLYKNPCHSSSNNRDSSILQFRRYIKARTLFAPFTRFYLSVTVQVGTEITMTTNLASGKA